MVPVAAVIGTDHTETDLHVRLARLLETLVPADQLGIAAGNDVTLAEQGSACRFAGLRIGHGVIA
ncbi:hypothetical protein D3C85_1453430 [compost metagenome]